MAQVEKKLRVPAHPFALNNATSPNLSHPVSARSWAGAAKAARFQLHARTGALAAGLHPALFSRYPRVIFRVILALFCVKRCRFCVIFRDLHSDPPKSVHDRGRG